LRACTRRLPIAREFDCEFPFRSEADHDCAGRRWLRARAADPSVRVQGRISVWDLV